jgi:hypothetical protein
MGAFSWLMKTSFIAILKTQIIKTRKTKILMQNTKRLLMQYGTSLIGVSAIGSVSKPVFSQTPK